MGLIRQNYHIPPVAQHLGRLELLNERKDVTVIPLQEGAKMTC